MTPEVRKRRTENKRESANARIQADSLLFSVRRDPEDPVRCYFLPGDRRYPCSLSARMSTRSVRRYSSRYSLTERVRECSHSGGLSLISASFWPESVFSISKPFIIAVPGRNLWPEFAIFIIRPSKTERPDENDGLDMFSLLPGHSILRKQAENVGLNVSFSLLGQL